MYDSRSKVAECFIDDAEIRASLAEAEERKNDIQYVKEILEKGRMGKGL